MVYNKPKDEESESYVWNDAKNYISSKVHYWLVLIDNFESLAIFGTNDIYGDVFMKDNNLRNTARIRALDRLIHAMITLIRNTKFAIKPEDKNAFMECTKRLNKIKKFIPKLKMEVKRGRKVVELNIDETLFENMMNEIHEKIDDINVKINKAGLIFAQFDELDIDKLKENLEKEFLE